MKNLRNSMIASPLIVFALLLQFAATNAYAEGCYYEGVSYKEGTTLGPYRCHSDGTWKKDQ